MKDCNRFEKLLPGYLHGELYESDYHALRAHLETCPACRAELEALRITFELSGRVLAAVPTPVRMSGWRYPSTKKVNLRTHPLVRLWFSPPFKAALATLVIAFGVYFVSGMFVVFTVVNKPEAEFAPPPPLERPRMKLKKPRVKVTKSAQPQQRDKIVVKARVPKPGVSVEETLGMLDESASDAFRPSSRIVGKIKTVPMPDIQLPDLAGSGEGLMGGVGKASSEYEEIHLFGRLGSEPAELAAEVKQDRYADPFARPEPAPVLSGPVAGEPLFADAAFVADDGMDDLFGGGAVDSDAMVAVDQVDGYFFAPSSGSKTAADKDRVLGERSASTAGVAKTWDFEKPMKRERKPAAFNPYVLALENAFSTFSIDVDTAAYGLARRELLDGSLPDTEAVRTEEFVNSFDYNYRPPAGRQTFAVHTEMAPSPFRRSMELMRVGIKGRRIGRDDHRNAVLTLVVDTSGSMSTPERLGLVKKSLALLLDQLSPEDQVAIVQFGGDARLVLEHTPVSEKGAILAAVQALQPGGPTQFDEGLELGYQLAADGFQGGDSNRIIIMSDGVANLGELDPEAILEQVADYRRQGIYLSVLGFGAGIYDDDLLERLANRGDGMYAYVDTMDEARQLFVDQLAATLHVIASDVKIQIEFNPDRVLRYRQLGYENRQLTKEQFRDDTVDAGEVGSGQSVTALYDVELKPGGAADDPIATVYVRYRRADNGAVEEISSRVMESARAARFEEADVRFQLAALVAEFAEKLRRSPYSEGTDVSDVLERLQPVLLELELDEKVRELERLMAIAVGLEN